METIRSVRDTVTTMLRDKGLTRYIADAEPVIAALEEREHDIALNLSDYAQERGLSSSEATAVLRNAGLAWREPEPETPQASGVEGQVVEAVKSSLTELLATIDRLTA